MADSNIHKLPASKPAGALQHVSTALSGLLAKAGYRPIHPEREALATAAVAILTGNYRRDDAASVEIRTEALIAVLAEYPEDCIRYVTDPRTGIQSYKYSVWRNGQEKKGPFISFPPESGELEEACEKYMLPIRRREEHVRYARELADERAREIADEPQRALNDALMAQKLAELKLGRATASARSSVEDRAGRIARSLEHAESTRRVQEDLAARASRREAKAGGA